MGMTPREYFEMAVQLRTIANHCTEPSTVMLARKVAEECERRASEKQQSLARQEQLAPSFGTLVSEHPQHDAKRRPRGKARPPAMKSKHN